MAKKILFGISIICAASFCLNAIALNQLIRRFDLRNFGNDDFSRKVGRYTLMKTHIPVHEVIGYIDDYSDLSGENDVLPNDAAARGFFTALYAFSPTIVEYNQRKHFIIGDFTGTSLPNAVANNYKILHYFGDGLYLLERL
jgi:hypothetical protein